MNGGNEGESEDVCVSHIGSHCSSKTKKSIEMGAMMSNEDREKALEAEFFPDDSLVEGGDGLESRVAVDEVREVDTRDGVEVEVEMESGVSRLEGIGMREVSDGMGESNEPVMLLMLSDI